MSSKRQKTEQKAPEGMEKIKNVITSVPGDVAANYLKYLNVADATLLLRVVLAMDSRQKERKWMSRIEGIDDSGPRMPPVVFDWLFPLVARTLQRLSLRERRLSAAHLDTLARMTRLAEVRLWTCHEDALVALDRLEAASGLKIFTLDAANKAWSQAKLQQLWFSVPGFVQNHTQMSDLRVRTLDIDRPDVEQRWRHP
jgi:hypothetical protein